MDIGANKNKVSDINYFSDKEKKGFKGLGPGGGGGLNKTKTKPRRSFLTKIVLILVFSILGLVGFFMVVFYVGNSYLGELNSVEGDLYNFRREAVQFDLLNSGGFSLERGNLSGEMSLADVISQSRLLLDSGIGIYRGFYDLVVEGSILLQRGEEFFQDLPDLMFNYRGEDLLDRLEEINSSLNKVANLNSILANIDFGETASANDFYFPLQSQLSRYRDFTSSVSSWLNKPSPGRILLVFQNPESSRPAGGKIEALGSLEIQDGAIKKIEVFSSSELEKKKTVKLIPPEPIRSNLSSWSIGDAGWFFDFPVSAERIIQMAESTDVFINDDIIFDGLIIVTPKVFVDLLSISGSTAGIGEIPSADDFLEKIADHPDKISEIIKEINPGLFDRLGKLTVIERQRLVAMFQKWITEKDIMFYFKDPQVQSFFENSGLAGKLFDVPSNFIGDYLGITAVDYGSDINPLKKNINLSLRVDNNGRLNSHLIISGVQENEYVEVFVPKESRLDSFSGGQLIKKKSYSSFEDLGYTSDPLLFDIELNKEDSLYYSEVNVSRESGKAVFSSWGKGGNDFIFDYGRSLVSSPKSGQAYQFVFERASGDNNDYKIEIAAPVGFGWRENNLPVFEYESSNLPGRVIIDLTLEELN